MEIKISLNSRKLEDLKESNMVELPPLSIGLSSPLNIKKNHVKFND